MIFLLILFLGIAILAIPEKLIKWQNNLFGSNVQYVNDSKTKMERFLIGIGCVLGSLVFIFVLYKANN